MECHSGGWSQTDEGGAGRVREPSGPSKMRGLGRDEEARTQRGADGLEGQGEVQEQGILMPKQNWRLEDPR